MNVIVFCSCQLICSFCLLPLNTTNKRQHVRHCVRVFLMIVSRLSQGLRASCWWQYAGLRSQSARRPAPHRDDGRFPMTHYQLLQHAHLQSMHKCAWVYAIFTGICCIYKAGKQQNNPYLLKFRLWADADVGARVVPAHSVAAQRNIKSRGKPLSGLISVHT